MKKNGYTTMQLLVVIVVLGIFTLTLLATTSYAYKDHSGEYYKEKVTVIEKQATLYGESLPELKEEGNKVITLDELIESGYYVADNDKGDVIDPRNDKATLNNLKIKLSYENEIVKAKVIEES